MTHKTLHLNRTGRAAIACFLVLQSFIVATTGLAADWPYWRGPQMNGTALATGLPDNWDPKGGEGSNLLWKREDLGTFCTPVAMNGRLYSIQRHLADTDREGEKVVCLDGKTGETIWENSFNVWLSDVPGERLGWTSVVADPDSGNVYVLGSCDVFLCINAETGQTVWQVPLHEQFGMLSTYGGRTNFPIIHEDLVIISGIIINWGDYARPNHRLLGLNKLTGEVVWFSGTVDLPDDTTYSAPSLVTIDGQRQLIMGTGDGAIWSFQPRTGKPLWHYDLSLRGLFAGPLVVGDMVFCSHNEENSGDEANVMGAVAGLKVTGTGAQTKVEEIWKAFEVVCGFSEPVMVDDRLYVVDDRCKMWVFDAATGKAIVEQEKFADSRQRSALLYADGKIFVTTENGRWSIVKPTPEGFEVINEGRLRNETFVASPIIADGRLYFQSTRTLYCISNETAQQQPQQISESYGTERPIAEDTAVAQLQIIPAESLIKPGESIEYRVNAFNAIGQKLDTPTGVSFRVEGAAATIEGNRLTASADATHTGVKVYAELGGVTTMARTRIVPPLPWKFTFDGLTDPPLSWVGARYRHVIRDVEGSAALVKITTIPKGARSRAWMGPSDLAEYTIQSDVRGARTLDALPDIGLTAHGYVLDLMGETQEVQLRTWDASEERISAKVKFPWSETQWYRMKLRVDLESEGPAQVAVVRGKVWPRDQPEPTEWTVEMQDQSPNLSASPGLSGNAKVAEIYMDNIEVFANGDGS